jgi:RecA-family ATPase
MSTSFISGAEYLAMPRPAETFLIEPLLPQGGSMVIWADPKVGKSYMALQLAIAVAGGQGGEWLGFPVKQTGPVAYLQLDTPSGLWVHRLKELERNGEPVSRIHFADRELWGTWPFNIANEQHRLQLRAAVRSLDPALVIIDTLKESHQAPENDNTEMQRVITGLEAAIQPAALVLIHHGRKPSAEMPTTTLNGSRGAGYLTGKMDTIIHITKRTCSIVGRAIEETSIKIERLDNGFWATVDQDLDRIIQSIVEDADMSDRAKAKRLSERINRSEEACRGLIRRWKAAHRATSRPVTIAGS